jgi:hypothetical protein
MTNLFDPKKTNMGLGFLPQGGAQAALNGVPLQNIPLSDVSMGDWWKGVNQYGVNTDGVNHITGAATPGSPEAQGGWFDMKGKGGMALGAAQVGLGVYSAINQEKQNDFMRGYYGNQMALQKTDFMNSADDLNRRNSEREGRRLEASKGIMYGTTANDAGRADYMKNWGVKNSF